MFRGKGRAALLAVAAVVGCGWSLAVAQTSTYTRTAQNLVMNQMERDWGEKVRAQWTSTNVRRINSDLIKVDGKGVAARVSQKGRVHFTYNVTLYPRTKRAPMVSYDMKGYEDVGLNTDNSGRGPFLVSQRSDASYRARARTLAEKEVERQLGMNMNVTFNTASVYAVKSGQRGVRGTGKMWAKDKWNAGKFSYTVIFDSRTGRNISTTVKITAKPG